MIPPIAPETFHADWQARVRALEDQARLAFLAQDLDTLRVLWSDDLVINTPRDFVIDKRQALDHLARGVIAHTSYEEEIEVLQRHEDVVVVMGRDVVVGAPGSPPVHRRFTNVWRAEGGSWRMIARHANQTEA